jgi:hypothetical protein
MGTYAEGQTDHPTHVEPQAENTYAEGVPGAKHPLHPTDEGTYAEGMSDGDPSSPNTPDTGRIDDDYVVPFTDEEERDDRAV